MKFDLHMHTNFSDGLLSVEELLKRCKDRDLETVAIVDHDTVDHIAPATKVGNSLGIRVIPGIELSVVHGRKSFHLLGYHIDPECAELKAELACQQSARHDRIEKMADKLRDNGWHVDLDGALDKHGSIGRPLLAQIVFEDERNRERCEHEGLSSFPELLNDYLTDGAPAWVDRYRTTMERGIELIHAAGGLAVWAHPVWNTRKTPETLEPTLAELVQLELDGIEVFYGNHTREDSERLLALAREHDLIASAGSDFHALDRRGFPDVGGWSDYGIAWSPDPRLI